MQIIHSESWLFSRLQGGDVKAFEKIYYTHSPSIYLNIVKMVKRDTIAQELLQDIFIKLWDKRERINITTDLAGYLYRMSANRVADYFTANANNKMVLMDIADSACSYNPIHDSIALKETNQLINDAIAALPTKRREVFELCRLEGKSHSEASKLLGISEHTVHSQMGKAMKFLKGRLKINNDNSYQQ